MTDFSARLTHFTRDSQIPPMQGEEGRLKFHSTSGSSKYFLTEFSSSPLKPCFNSLSALLKFEQLSQ